VATATRDLGDVLSEKQLVDEEGLQRARQAQAQQGGSLASTVVRMGLVSERDLVTAIGEQIGMPFADVAAGVVDPDAASLVARDVARELMALPVAFNRDGSLQVAVADPKNRAALDRVASVTNMEVTGALAVRSELQGAIEALTDDPVSDGGGGGLGVSPNPVEPLSAATPAPAENGEAAPGKADGDEGQPGVDLAQVLLHLVAEGGSDVHFTAGRPPMMRIDGELVPYEGYDVLNPDDVKYTIYGLLTSKQRSVFEKELELDLSYNIPGEARFRVNVFQQRGAMAAVMRVVPYEIKSIEELGLPPQITNFAYLPRGFVLVTGPTGSGKSTTLASLIGVVNQHRACHIVTVEDPIEFLHSHDRSVINQRELGEDTHSFAAALKHALRQDPDVILVGELRDLETIQVALTAAETGQLVFGTLHTQDAPQTIDRLIDVFPPHQQEQIRVMLAGSLQGVVCQQLMKTADGKGRQAASEVLTATPATRNLVREGKTHQLYSSMQAGREHGMLTMDQSLAELVRSGQITYQAALDRCSNVNDFNRLAGRA
jgi:twitching motility protein PilT